MPKQWNLAPRAPQQVYEEFPELPALAVQLLFNLGITHPAAAQSFLSPQYDQLHSPFLFRDMQKAVERIWQAIDRGEKILIYSDYDADAVTANAVLQQTFRYLDVAVDSYIPDRFSEGYGLNLEAFEKIKSAGVNLVITVDCGTNSADVAEFCRQNGIDLIITDHHEITGALPNSFALINPKNPADAYPDTQITGVGVAYKLAKAVLSNKEKVVARKNIAPDQYVDWDKWLLDLVAIGTVADCHSLLGENRILVSLGLKVLAKTRWLGLKELMRAAGVDVRPAPLDTYTLGFMIAPRVNAAGRLEHADSALALLLAQDYAQAVNLAQELETINKRRQDLTLRVVSEARDQAQQQLDRKVLMVSDAAWPRGLVGLVAGKLAEQYRRPVVVLEQGEVECTGSARSVGEFNLVECLKSVEHLLVRYGGHKQAAGLTLRTEHLTIFYQHILRYAETASALSDAEDVINLAAQLQEADLILPTADLVAKFEPFGVDNLRPRFLVRRAAVAGMRAVGSNQKHLQMQLMVGNQLVDAIGFNLAYLMEQLDGYKMIDLAAEVMADIWNGSRKFKLRVIDIKPHEAAGY